MKSKIVKVIIPLLFVIFLFNSCFLDIFSKEDDKSSIPLARVVVPLDDKTLSRGIGETNVSCYSYTVTLQSGSNTYEKTVYAPATSVSFEVNPATYTAYVAGFNSDGVLIARG